MIGREGAAAAGRAQSGCAAARARLVADLAAAGRGLLWLGRRLLSLLLLLSAGPAAWVVVGAAEHWLVGGDPSSSGRLELLLSVPHTSLPAAASLYWFMVFRRRLATATAARDAARATRAEEAAARAEEAAAATAGRGRAARLFSAVGAAGGWLLSEEGHQEMHGGREAPLTVEASQFELGQLHGSATHPHHSSPPAPLACLRIGLNRPLSWPRWCAYWMLWPALEMVVASQQLLIPMSGLDRWPAYRCVCVHHRRLSSFHFATLASPLAPLPTPSPVPRYFALLAPSPPPSPLPPSPLAPPFSSLPPPPSLLANTQRASRSSAGWPLPGCCGCRWVQRCLAGHVRPACLPILRAQLGVESCCC